MTRRVAKRNRRRDVKSVLAWQPFTGIILLVLSVALGYMSYTDKNRALQDEIDSKQSELGRLKEQCMREESRWNAMQTEENFNDMMERRCMDMKVAESHQVIKMGENGKPLPGQYSVARFAKKLKERGNVVNAGRQH